MSTTNGGRAKVDLNQADAATLAGVEGFDERCAQLVIDFREQNGPFRSWAEVEAIDGVGPALTEKLREAASLDERAGEGEGQGEIEMQAIEIDVDEIAEDELVEALVGLAELDCEAAAGYRVAAESIDDGEARAQLERFREDHIRHVRDINEILEQMSCEPVDEELEPDESLFARLAQTAALLGDGGVVLAMISNEQLTNGTYQAALLMPASEETRAVIQRNLEDEQRHLRWLLEARARMGMAAAEERPESAAP